MKKVKIMLMSLLVFAVVGGALAFKAKFNTEYCTTLPRVDGSGLYCTNAAGANLLCPNPALNRTITNSGSPVCTTIMPIDGVCDVQCINVVTFTKSNL